MNKKELSQYISIKNKDNNKEIIYILETSIKSFLKINKRHLNMFLNNNLNLTYFTKTEISGKILNINYIIKEDNIKIDIYEYIGNKKLTPKINKIDLCEFI